MPLQTEIKNRFGRVAGWNQVQINVLGRTLEGVNKIEYQDSLEIEGVRGAGRYYVGTGEGQYDASGAVTLLSEELIGLQRSLQPGQRIQDIEVGDIVVTFEYNNTIVTDILRGCRFMNNGREVGSGDKEIFTQIDLFISHIDYSVV